MRINFVTWLQNKMRIEIFGIVFNKKPQNTVRKTNEKSVQCLAAVSNVLHIFKVFVLNPSWIHVKPLNIFSFEHVLLYIYPKFNRIIFQVPDFHIFTLFRSRFPSCYYSKYFSLAMIQSSSKSTAYSCTICTKLSVTFSSKLFHFEFSEQSKISIGFWIQW